MTEHLRIAMFSGPRNISTTMMRAFENRQDTAVYDEPYYACYLKQSGALHPMRERILASQSCDWEKVGAMLSAPPPGNKEVAFEKHIAFHFTGGASLDWVRGTRVFQLIRDPRAMVASYQNKYGDVAPIIDSLKVQRRIYEDCLSRDAPCPIVDSGDIQKDPEGMLRALCAALDIPFSQNMLSWPPGPRDSDGVWAAHWYDAVNSSTGFRPYAPRELSLSPELEKIAEACAEDFDFFHRARMRT